MAALSLGVALAWSLRSPVVPDAGMAKPVAAREPGAVAAPEPAAAADAQCDARCAAPKVIVAATGATGACTASVEELAGFGVRWQGADAAIPKFDRFAWLNRGRGTLTLGGMRAGFRNPGSG